MSEKIVRYCAVILSLTWGFCAVSWFVWQCIPYEMLSFATYLFGAVVGLGVCRDCVLQYCEGKKT